MSPSNVETLINLLMLLALFVGLAIWWMTKHGGRRGRIAERVREAAAQPSDRSRPILTTTDRKASFGRRVLRRLAAFGDKLPLFDANTARNFVRKCPQRLPQPLCGVSSSCRQVLRRPALRRADGHAGSTYSNDRLLSVGRGVAMMGALYRHDCFRIRDWVPGIAPAQEMAGSLLMRSTCS